MERTSNKSGHTPVVWPLPGKSAIFLLRSYFWHHYQHLWLPLSSTIDCIKNSFQSFNSLWYVHVFVRVFAGPEQLRHFHTEHSATWVRTCIQGLVSIATAHRQPGNGSLRVHCCESEFHSHFFFFEQCGCFWHLPSRRASIQCTPSTTVLKYKWTVKIGNS